MSDDTELISVEQGDEIPAVVVESGQITIALRPIADCPGLDWSARYRHPAGDPVLRAQSSVAVTAMDGRTREQVCRPLGHLNGWLLGISADRARPQLYGEFYWKFGVTG